MKRATIQIAVLALLLALDVGRFGTVYDRATGGFTGDWVVLAAFTTFCLLTAAIMFDAYRALG